MTRDRCRRLGTGELDRAGGAGLADDPLGPVADVSTQEYFEARTEISGRGCVMGGPFSLACRVAGCPQPPGPRGRCAKHSQAADASRGLGSDRCLGGPLYRSKAWREVRAQVLAWNLYCQCQDCVRLSRRWRATVVHHKVPHGGEPTKFFDPHNLVALAKRCHDRLTGHARAGSGYTLRDLGQDARPVDRRGVSRACGRVRRGGSGGQDGERGA